MKPLVRTDASWAPAILRIGLGAAMFPHGAQKLFGWFGGGGFLPTLQLFTTQMHIPALLAVLVILAESLGSVGLILGLLTRVAAFGIACVMVGAVAMVHWHNGFFMNWSGHQAGEGFEYHVLAITICLALMVAGGGRYSLDRKMTQCL